MAQLRVFIPTKQTVMTFREGEDKLMRLMLSNVDLL